MIDDTTLSPTPDAFVQAAAPLTFATAPLHAYTRRRYQAAQAMGLLYPDIGDENLERLRAGKLYAGQVRDVTIVLWLCSIPQATDATPDEIKMGGFTVELAILKPLRAWEAALAWSEEHGLCDPQDARFREAMALFSRLVLPVEDSRFEVAIDGAKPGGAPDPKASTPAPTPNTP